MIVMPDLSKPTGLRQRAVCLIAHGGPGELRICQHESALVVRDLTPRTLPRRHGRSQGTDMLALQNASQNLESIRILLVIFVILTVAFWKTMLKIVIITVLAVILVLITAGAATLLQHAHLFIK